MSKSGFTEQTVSPRKRTMKDKFEIYHQFRMIVQRLTWTIIQTLTAKKKCQKRLVTSLGTETFDKRILFLVPSILL